MTLLEMATLVCSKVGKTDPESIEACKGFLRQRQEVLYQGGLFKDALDVWTVEVKAGQSRVVLPIGLGRPLAVWNSESNLAFDIESLATVILQNPAKFKGGGNGMQAFMETARVAWPFDLRDGTAPDSAIVGSQVEFSIAPAEVSLTISAAGMTYSAPPFNSDTPFSTAYGVTAGHSFLSPAAWVRLDTLTKPKTIQSVFCRQISNGRFWIWPAEFTTAEFATIQLLPPLTVDTTLSVYGKRAFRQMHQDGDTPMVRGLNNALLAFAQGDMLERSRQYGKASAKVGEAGNLVAIARDEDTNQSAWEARIVPVVPSQEGTEEFMGW